MNSVIKGASYVLAHTPQMVVYNGTTQTTERIVNPESEYLKELESHLRSYEDCVNYWPNQVYIGNATPEELAEVEFPYYDKVKDGAERYGKYGEIMPEEEFLLLVQACDQFEVVMLRLLLCHSMGIPLLQVLPELHFRYIPGLASNLHNPRKNEDDLLTL